jgi:hypothetical protein
MTTGMRSHDFSSTVSPIQSGRLNQIVASAASVTFRLLLPRFLLAFSPIIKVL